MFHRGLQALALFRLQGSRFLKASYTEGQVDLVSRLIIGIARATI